jgi:hypothetical protein
LPRGPARVSVSAISARLSGPSIPRPSSTDPTGVAVRGAPGQPPAGLQADHPGPAAASNSQARSATTVARARHGGRAQRLRVAGGEGVKAGAGAPRSNRCVMHQ